MDAVEKGDQIFHTEEDMTTEEINAISYFAEWEINRAIRECLISLGYCQEASSKVLHLRKWHTQIKDSENDSVSMQSDDEISDTMSATMTSPHYTEDKGQACQKNLSPEWVDLPTWVHSRNVKHSPIKDWVQENVDDHGC